MEILFKMRLIRAEGLIPSARFCVRALGRLKRY